MLVHQHIDLKGLIYIKREKGGHSCKLKASIAIEAKALSWIEQALMCERGELVMVSYYPIAGGSYSPAHHASRRVWLDCVAKRLYATKTCLWSLSKRSNSYLHIFDNCTYSCIYQCSSRHPLSVFSSIQNYLQTDSSIPKTQFPFITTSPSVVTFNTFMHSLNSPIPRSPSPAIPSLLAPHSPSHSLQASHTAHHSPHLAP